MKMFVMPIYTPFYNRFAASGFTSKPDKFVKYSVPTLESMIDSFFEGDGSS
jgi:hypothetical protein